MGTDVNHETDDVDEVVDITEITETAGTRLERSITLDADVGLAWELLTSPDELTGWLGDEVDLDPTPGSEGSVLDRDGNPIGILTTHDLLRAFQAALGEAGDALRGRVRA